MQTTSSIGSKINQEYERRVAIVKSLRAGKTPLDVFKTVVKLPKYSGKCVA